MGFLSSFSSPPKHDKRGYNPAWLQQLNTAFSTANLAGSAGVTIPNEQTALTVSSVWSAMKLLSEIPASLDVQYRILNDGYFEHITDDAIARTLRKPNGFQTRYQFFQSMFMKANLRGNSYAFIKRSAIGEQQMIPINSPVDVSVSPDGNEVFYTINGTPFVSSEIIHFRGMSIDGYVGLSPIYYAARVVNNNIDSQKFMSKVYESGILTTGFFTTAERLIDKTYERLKKDIKAKSGIERAGEAQILEQGLKFERNTLSAVDTELLDQMNFSVEEFCRIYRIPKHLMYLDAKGGSTRSFSTQAREFLTYSLAPSLDNVEQELSLKLLTEDQYASGNYKIRFDTKELLRAAPEERSNYYKTLFNIGSMTPNEIRAEEGMPPVEGGDKTFVQLNLSPMDMLEDIIQDKINQQINSTN